MPLPLQGVTVLDVTTNVAGPFATVILADLGAEVIKVEPPGGDDSRRMAPTVGDSSAFFLLLNRNKLSVRLDLKDETDRRAIDELLGRADVVVTNLLEPKRAVLGLDEAGVRARHPRIVYADLSAFGPGPDEAARPGYDAVVQARAGLLSINGAPGSEPSRVGVSILDMGSGIWLALGVLAALRVRDAGGRGATVSTSLLEVAASWMSYHAVALQLTGANPARTGSSHPAFSPYGVFETGDGQLMIGVGADHLFRRLAGELGVAGLADDPRFLTNELRVGHRAELQTELETALAGRGAPWWSDRLAGAGIPVSVVNDTAGLLADAQLDRLGMWHEQPAGEREGTVRVPGLPLRLDGGRPPARFPARPLGGDTDTVVASRRPAGGERD